MPPIRGCPLAGCRRGADLALQALVLLPTALVLILAAPVMGELALPHGIYGLRTLGRLNYSNYAATGFTGAKACGGPDAVGLWCVAGNYCELLPGRDPQLKLQQQSESLQPPFSRCIETYLDNLGLHCCHHAGTSMMGLAGSSGSWLLTPLAGACQSRYTTCKESRLGQNCLTHLHHAHPVSAALSVCRPCAQRRDVSLLPHSLPLMLRCRGGAGPCGLHCLERHLQLNKIMHSACVGGCCMVYLMLILELRGKQATELLNVHKRPAVPHQLWQP